MLSRFFDSTESDPRDYNSANFADYFETFITPGVVGLTGSDLAVSSAGSQTIEIAAGRVFIRGYMGVMETPERLTLPGNGRHSVALRLDLSPSARKISPVIIGGSSSFPAPVRAGNIYDLVVAQVLVSGTSVTVTDTRGDVSLCGYAAFKGQPPYQPPGDITADLWQYGAFPDSLTATRRTQIEATPSMMEIFNSSRLTSGIQTYLTPGTYTFTAPGTGWYWIEVVGGGGCSSWGGWGGSCAKKWVKLDKGQKVTVTVGTGGVAGSDFGDGTASSFGSYATATGGRYSNGGTATGGDINIPGGRASMNQYAPVAGSSALAPAGSGILGAGDDGNRNGAPGGVIIRW